MKLGILYSGGKDSNYALYELSKENEITCLINLESQNQDSYMFQSAGNNVLKLQSQALQIPILSYKTKGLENEELTDLKNAIQKAKEEYGIEGIGTGAIKSTYQASRIQKICNDLGLWCFNPLWQIDEKEYLNKLIENKFKIMIIKIASYPFNKNWLGKKIDKNFKTELEKINQTQKMVSYVGEGGEFESLVLDAPTFKQEIEIQDSKIIMDSENCGELIITNCRLIKK